MEFLEGVALKHVIACQPLEMSVLLGLAIEVATGELSIAMPWLFQKPGRISEIVLLGSIAKD